MGALCDDASVERGLGTVNGCRLHLLGSRHAALLGIRSMCEHFVTIMRLRWGCAAGEEIGSLVGIAAEPPATVVQSSRPRTSSAVLTASRPISWSRFAGFLGAGPQTLITAMG